MDNEIQEFKKYLYMKIIFLKKEKETRQNSRKETEIKRYQKKLLPKTNSKTENFVSLLIRFVNYTVVIQVRLAAVSYTHLDVYKRQPCRRYEDGWIGFN